MSDDTTHAIHKALGSIATRPAGYALLGRGDSSGVIAADPNQRLLYYFNLNQPPATAPLIDTISILPYLGVHPELEGVRVRLGYPPERPNVLHIVGFDQGEGLSSVKGITPAEQLQASQSFISVGSLTNFRLSPNEPVDSEVYINPGWYLGLDGKPVWWGGDSTDTLLAAAIALLSSGTHQMAVTFIDASTNTPAIVTSDAQAGGVGDKQLFDTTTIEELSIPDGYAPTGAVHLYYGQTEITEEDIYRAADPRVVFGRTGSSTGTDSGFPIVIDTAVTVAANRQVIVNRIELEATGSIDIIGELFFI